MTDAGFTLFDTAIGPCGIAWGAGGITGVQLPEGSRAATRARLAGLFPDATEADPPPEVAAAVDRIRALLAGEPVDLADVSLDLTGLPPFRRRVYEAAREVPPGRTVSYGELAEQLGSPRAARAVGQALSRNPFAIVVPCHRVVGSGGRSGGFSAAGGVATKQRMLAIEQAAGDPAPAARPAQRARRAAPATRTTAAAGRPAEATAAASGPYPFDAGAAVAHLEAADPALARWMARVGPVTLELKTGPTVFAVLAEAITYQQLSGKAAATIFGRVRALAAGSDGHPTAARLRKVTDEQLRGAGLSRAKVLAVRDLAARDEAGELPTLAQAAELDDETVVRELTRVRGIGRWSAEMFLIFRLGRPDVLPVDDLGIRSAVAVTHGLPSPADPATLRELAAAWQPYRSVACWYLWEVAELVRREPGLR